jgi:molybdopterin converting factor small subunit
VRVTVEYFGPAREAAGLSREVVETEPCTAVELVTRVAREKGGRFARLLLAGDALGPSVLIAVGDRQATPDDPIPLRDGDEVAVIPPVSGGGRTPEGSQRLTRRICRRAERSPQSIRTPCFRSSSRRDVGSEMARTKCTTSQMRSRPAARSSSRTFRASAWLGMFTPGIPQ